MRQDMESVMEWRRLGDALKTIRMCEHEQEVEVRYGDCDGLRFRMCRECWNREAFHRINRNSVQVIRPSQLEVVYAKCLKCGSGMDSCGCGA